MRFMDSTRRTVKIGVDSARALEALSGSVFAAQDACIRELIANASDSITQLPPYLKSSLEIRLVPRFANANEGTVAGQLEIRDTGTGMSPEEAEQYLARLFASSKTAVAGVIGQFGIGFYSCFRLCTLVEVFTRSHAHADTGTRILYTGGDTLALEPFVVEKPGTTVVLHLKNEFKQLLHRDALIRLVQRYCDFVPYPIYVGDYGHDILNKMVAPWDTPAQSEHELTRSLTEIYGVTTPLHLFPFQTPGGRPAPISGLMFVPKPGEGTFFRLYCHRVLITTDARSLLPETFWKFVSAVIDADNLPLLLSRDGLVENSPRTRQLTEFLVNFLADSLAALGRTRREDFRQLMNIHGGAIKGACLENGVILGKLLPFIAYRTSDGDTVTIPEYLDGRADDVILFSDNPANDAALFPLYRQRGDKILLMTDGADRALRNRWPPRSGHAVIFQRADAVPPVASVVNDTPRNSPFSPVTAEVLQNLFHQILKEPVQIRLQALGAEAPPSLLSLDEEQRNQIGFLHAARRMKDENRVHELPAQMQEMINSGYADLLLQMSEQSLILNESHPIVVSLLNRCSAARSQTAVLDGIDELLVRYLHGQALLSANLPLATNKIAEIHKDQHTLLARLLIMPDVKPR